MILSLSRLTLVIATLTDSNRVRLGLGLGLGLGSLIFGFTMNPTDTNLIGSATPKQGFRSAL